MSTNAKKRKSLRERRKIQRRKLQIRVSSGDTLWDIAKEYRTEEYSDISSYIAEVREINHLSSNQITDGMYLCIPYYSEEYKS